MQLLYQIGLSRHGNNLLNFIRYNLLWSFHKSEWQKYCNFGIALCPFFTIATSLPVVANFDAELKLDDLALPITLAVVEKRSYNMMPDINFCR